jgi:hypothetical protein
MASAMEATLWYLQDLELWKTTKPYFINVPMSAIPPGHSRSNEISVPVHDVPVHNMREEMSQIGLDTTGFTFRRHKSQIPLETLEDSPILRDEYIPEIEEWLRSSMGADIVKTITFQV